MRRGGHDDIFTIETDEEWRRKKEESKKKSLTDCSIVHRSHITYQPTRYQSLLIIQEGTSIIFFFFSYSYSVLSSNQTSPLLSISSDQMRTELNRVTQYKRERLEEREQIIPSTLSRECSNSIHPIKRPKRCLCAGAGNTPRNKRQKFL